MQCIHVVHSGNGSLAANRLFQTLSEHFGKSRVKRNVLPDDLAAGDLLVVVLERNHLELYDVSLQDIIRSALKRNIPLLPVWVDQTGMPGEKGLPDALKPLAHIPPARLRNDRWNQDMADLIRRIEPLIAMQGQGVPTMPAPSPVPEKASPGGFGRLKKIFSGWFGRPPEAPPSTAEKAEPPRMVERGGSMPESEPADLQEVFLGASAPAALPPGDEFTARFVAYLEDEKGAVEAMLRQLSPRSTSVLGVKRCRWQPGTRVTVSLSGRWIEVEAPEQTFIWDSATIMLDFDVRLGADAPQGATILKFDVAIDGIRVAKLRMDLEVVDHRTASPPQTAVTEAARTAFASYASNDRQRVLDRLASIRISAGLDVFMDCLSLRPGDRWKLELAKEIRSRDQFLLFWSHSAATSQWVAWEWQTALNEKGPAEMQIHPLENNVSPPVELSDLHFGDVFVAVRDAQAERT